jgi:hypothetical protein
MEKKESKFVKEYIAAYKAMRDSAIEKMKNYGKTLDMVELLKEEYQSESENPTEEGEEDYVNDGIFWCYFEGKHDNIWSCKICKARWNEERECVEVYLEDAYGDVSDWFMYSYITGDMEMLWHAIHEFIPDPE